LPFSHSESLQHSEYLHFPLQHSPPHRAEHSSEVEQNPSSGISAEDVSGTVVDVDSVVLKGVESVSVCLVVKVGNVVDSVDVDGFSVDGVVVDGDVVDAFVVDGVVVVDTVADDVVAVVAVDGVDGFVVDGVVVVGVVGVVVF